MKTKWNIEAMYSDEKTWKKDIETAKKNTGKLLEYKGKLTESAETLYTVLSKKDAVWQKIEKAFVYARMKRDEDNRQAKYQGMLLEVQTAAAEIGAKLSFFTPEILSSKWSKIETFFKEEKHLQKYEFLLTHMFKEKKHVLSKNEEKLLAQLSEVLPATNEIFTMLNNADMSFEKTINEEGKKEELTHGNYIKFMESPNRKVRKSAYEKMYAEYESHINTLATSLNYNAKVDVVGAKIRKYPSALEASLSSDNVPKSVYTNLIKVVNENLSTLHQYMEIRGKALGHKKIKMYDVYTPIVQIPQKKISYKKATAIIAEGLRPLGKEYCKNMQDGFDAGWADVYEREGKTSGAYSFGSYDSMPYMLLNYTDTLKDVFTVAHEMGHSMHSFYTRKTQPYVYGGHSIFT
ncbi:MAG: M3 family oligoendopeptidase, partial [Anaerovoracaceae bacterium]